MLETFRRFASRIIVYALFTTLIASFAIWGIGDVVRRSGGTGPLAKVGNVTITAEEFQSALQDKRQQVAAQFGRTLTPEMMRQYGLDSTVLAELVTRAAVSEHAQQLGLRLSDAASAELVRADPLFQGADKQFNRQLFDERMRQAGLNATRYLKERKESTVREQLTNTLLEAVQPPDLMLDILHKYREETRTFEYVALDPAKLPAPATPDEAALKAQYDQAKGQFLEPETRSFTLLTMTRDALKERTKVDAAEVKAQWDANKDGWNIPERRRYQQIAFKTRAEAEAVAKDIQGGKSFLLASLEANNRQMEQGPVSRADVQNVKVADALFTLPVNQLSPVLDIPNGALLFRVIEIEPGKVRTFADVETEIRESLEYTKLRDVTTKLRDQIEDLRGAGKSLIEIGKEMSLPIREIATIDKTGKGPDGKPVVEGPDAGKILQAAFEAEKGVPHDAFEISDGAEAWIDLGEVKPETRKPFEKVQDEVKKLWTEAEVKKALTAEGNAIVERVKKGETLAAVAKAQGLKLETSKPIKRSDPPAVIGLAGQRQLFTLAKGAAAAVESADTKTRIVVAVSDIKAPAAPTKEERERLAQDLKRQLQNDAFITYVAALRERFNVSVDEAAYRRSIGVDRTQ